MSKDYAKRRRQHSRKRFHTAPNFYLPTWAWLILGSLLGAGLAVSLNWKAFTHRTSASSDVTFSMQTPSGHTVSKTLAKASTQPSGEKRFDFYNLLPNLAQESTEQAVPSQEKKAEKLTLSKGDVSYTIQAGSFRLREQAEELKAKLAMNGFEASVQTHVVNHQETWYRVYVGPFHDKSLALASQQKLEQTQALHSLIIKNRV